ASVPSLFHPPSFPPIQCGGTSISMRYTSLGNDIFERSEHLSPYIHQHGTSRFEGIISGKLTMTGLHRRGWTMGCSLMRFQRLGSWKNCCDDDKPRRLPAYIQTGQNAAFLSLLCQ